MPAPVVLGPQYPNPNVPAALAASDAAPGPVAVVSAGWRHEELETGPMEAAIGRPCKVIPLYAWFDDVQQALPQLAERYRDRQDRVQRYSELYLIRLGAALAAVHQLLVERERDPDVVDPELARAVEDVRRIDADLMARWTRLDEDYPELARPWEEGLVRARHHQAAEILEEAPAILVPGGHVAVLANRLAFFGFKELLQRAIDRGLPLITWSAGAMALSERVVLFYDDPPQGPGDPEVLGPGLGLLPGFVPFPHARRRLRLDDRKRVAEIAYRFAPDRCVTLENGAWLEMSEDGPLSRGDAGASSLFMPDGTLEAL
jgi:hypothetical protein